MDTTIISCPISTLRSLAFTPEKPHHFVHVISNLLAREECAHIINSHSNLIPSNVTPETVRTREIFDDGELAEALWARLRQVYEHYDTDVNPRRIVDEDGEVWDQNGLNSRFRLCLYEKGGKFSPHTDGRRLATINEQSFMTLNMYLNTVPDSAHGATRFIASPPTPYDPSVPRVVLAKSQPVLGSAAIFRDDLWHDGEELVEGQKWLLRTDVMYKRKKDFDFEDFCAARGLGKLDRGRKALEIAEELEDARCSEEAVKWYKIAFREWPDLERGE